MSKWLKILIGIIVGLFLLIVIAKLVLENTLLKTNYVNEPVLKGQLLTDSITINGYTRIFLWYAPLVATPPTRILYVLHGSASNGPDMRKQMAYEFDKIAEEKGVVVVYPTGYFNHWNDCRGTADYKANIDNIDDLDFFKQLEQKITTQLNTSFHFRFATGLSNGGHLCYKLALEAPEWIHGIAPIAANLPIDASLDCTKKGQFIPLLVINGTADKVNPYEGGLVSILGNDSRGTVLSAEETMKYWTSLGDCAATPKKTVVQDISTADNSSIEQYEWACGQQSKAVLYKVIGGGHTIPHPISALPSILGTTNQDINSPQHIWTFFEDIMKNSKPLLQN